MSSKRGGAIVVLSGGMDSTTALWLAIKEWGAENVVSVSFDYGQKHKKELMYALVQSNLAEIENIQIDLTGMSQHLKSALTSEDTKVPDGHYAEENMKQTVVPNRNSIMLNLAAGLAISRGFAQIYTAIHAGDHYVYPDCRPEFIKSLEGTLRIANEGFIDPDFVINAPFINMTKAEIVVVGEKLSVDWLNTWSCYKGEEIHCGICGTCGERRLAFMEKDIEDPTLYRVPLTNPSFLCSMVNEMASTGVFENSSIAKNLNLEETARSYGLKF